ncbi:hypothetical protein XF_1667 [Xylella fastidiosa 9a5c]|uniref:Uncharacterized protein n=1 Tax=Xylella fastidiosa (strain 9a5c) TaxID=160492 RepID=Q9PCT8_XYLFA|nr:hypothetical protein XF_1667 [Xylella fastidiosa 9a5c]
MQRLLQLRRRLSFRNTHPLQQPLIQAAPCRAVGGFVPANGSGALAITGGNRTTPPARRAHLHQRPYTTFPPTMTAGARVRLGQLINNRRNQCR